MQKSLASRFIAGALAAVLLVPLLVLAVPAQAFAWTVDTSARTEAEMRARWEQLKPTYTGAPYAVTPSFTAPYLAGDAAPGFRSDGLGIINFARYLSGLPSDVTLSATRNNAGQHGAVLLRVIAFSHTPSPKPADMDQSFYDLGYSATGSSNIGSGYPDSESFQRGCLEDSDPSNIARVGHRRWLLNPRMLYTGIGYADYRHTTYAFDSSRPSGEVSYSFVAWPSAGIFPVEFTSSRTPWSITLNPARYDWDSGFTVTMRRVSDGRMWTFDATDANTSGEFFSANFGGYGVANAFIFRPDPASIRYSAGDQFDVTLSGGIYAEGTRTPATVSYRTSFGALSGPSTSFGTPAPDPVPVPEPVADPAKSPVHRFYNKGNGSHFYTMSAGERDDVIAHHSDTYEYEGIAYTIDTTSPTNTSPLYRFYNKVSGSHFYTASESEKNSVIAGLSSTFTFEGPAYNVSLVGGTEMYRFYNKGNGSHFYTVSPSERDTVIRDLSNRFVYEGVNYYLGN